MQRCVRDQQARRVDRVRCRRRADQHRPAGIELRAVEVLGHAVSARSVGCGVERGCIGRAAIDDRIVDSSARRDENTRSDPIHCINLSSIAARCVHRAVRRVTASRAGAAAPCGTLPDRAMETEVFRPATRMESAGARCWTRRVQCSPPGHWRPARGDRRRRLRSDAPFVAWAGRSVGSLAVAALLHLGAALSALVLQRVVPRGDRGLQDRRAVARRDHGRRRRDGNGAARLGRSTPDLPQARCCSTVTCRRRTAVGACRATGSGVDRGRSAARR